MEFTCSKCGKPFTLPESVRERYPGWTPRHCRECHGAGQPRGKEAPAASGGQTALPADGDPVQATTVPVSAALDQALERMLQRHVAGPSEGLFTDGGCSGNPGPGGWGTVRVRDNRVVARMRGEHPSTTNNRMELTALLAGYRMVDPGDEATIWSDSQLCVNTVNEWAAGWARRGWRRKGGEIKNLDLVRPLYELSLSRPKVRLRWIKAHDGSRWNEYVDLLAMFHLR